MKLKKRGLHEKVRQVVIANTQMNESDLLNDLTNYDLKKVNDFAKIVKANEIITIFGDYDVDGICSSVIMSKLLKSLGKNSTIRLPKRMSEGFGLSEKAVDEINEGLIITVDNGINAIYPVKKAKEKGVSVIITDHHLADNELPEADLILNANAVPRLASFKSYCGAGLAYKIATKLINDEQLLNELCIYAMIATIADSVPLIKDNRVIVKNGLNLIRNGFIPKNIGKMLKAFNIENTSFTEEDVAFKIAPALNAPGRLYDDGANKSLNLLLADDESTADSLVEEIIGEDGDNEKRKELVSTYQKKVEEIIEREDLEHKIPIIINIDEMHEGIVGIIAGKLSEKYKVPSIILTKTEDGFKGSARAVEGFSLKSLFDEIAKEDEDIFVRYGGHALAAGLTIKEDKLNDFKDLCEKLLSKAKRPSYIPVYDLDITEDQIEDAIKELELYAPYGEGNPQPIFHIAKFNLKPNKKGEKYSLLETKAGKTVKFNGDNYFSALAFDKFADYEDMGKPETIEVIGTLSRKYWNGFYYKNMIISEFDAVDENEIPLEEYVINKIKQINESRKTKAETKVEMVEIPS